jgi:Tfp pilus assembly protein PilF
MRFYHRHRLACLCLALAVVTLALYWPVVSHDFINVDDPRFISQNPHVEAGLTRAGIRWAFQSLETENWQPLTWISHMLDCDLYGLNAGGHHLTSLLLHVANSVLLLVWLNGLTQSPWRSAFVAALFAWHPLHVESVAWACERKDVLSTSFWLLALLAYTRYARGMRPGAARPGVHPAFYYGLTLLFFACGLMSKPMVVTLPCVLLLLDFWPLSRFAERRATDPAGPPGQTRAATAAGLAMEKAPFFLLTLGMSMATLYAQKAGGALASLAGMPPAERLANTVVNYGTYLAKTFWPSGLAYFYPYRFDWPASRLAGDGLLLVALTGWSLWRWRREPYLLTGWLWFLGTLLPTVGLVQVGIQSLADRYMYIPSIGLFLALVWGLGGLFDRWHARREVLPALGGLALLGCLAVTSVQLGYWQNSITLATHAIEVTRQNYVAYESLGRALYEAGRKKEAMACYAESVRLRPDFPQSQFNFAAALQDAGRLPEAVEHFAAAARLVPDRLDIRMALGTTLMQAGRLEEAATQFAEVLRREPDSIAAHHSLGIVLARQGDISNAIPHFAAAVRLDPANADLRFGLGLALMDTHQPAAAAAQFEAEVQLAPNETRAHYRLAQALEQLHQPAAAAEHYQAALRLTPNFPEAAAALDQILAAHPGLPAREPLDKAR